MQNNTYMHNLYKQPTTVVYKLQEAYKIEAKFKLCLL